MNFIRFSDLCSNGFAAGKRVFIRADLNVPQADGGRITQETTSHLHDSLAAIGER